MRRILFWALIIMQSLVLSLCKAENNYNFKYYTRDDGLISNTIFDICQDSRNYLWFGSAEGLCRFDSYTFKKYNFQTTNTAILKSNSEQTRITAISSIGTDELWVGTSKGIFRHDYNTSSFIEITEIDYSFEAISFIGDQNNVWIASNRDGIIRYNKHDHSIKQYHDPLDVRTLLTRSNKVYAVSANHGIYMYDDRTDKFMSIAAKTGEKISSTSCSTMDSNGDIWLGDWRCGVFKYDCQNNNMTNYPISIEGKIIERIHSIIKYSNTEIMVGSDYGITIMNINTGKSHTITSDSNDIQGLNNRFVYPLCLDSDGGVWAGTYFGGVNYISPKNDYFNSIQHKSTSGHVISKFCEDDSHNIWIGTDDSGLHKFDLSTQQATRILIGGDKEPLNIHSLCADKASIWVGTYQTGVYNYNQFTKTAKHHTEIENVYAMQIDSLNNLWAGSSWGLYKYNRNADLFEKLNLLNDINGVRDLLLDDKNNMWIVSDTHGITRMDQAQKDVAHYNKVLLLSGINPSDIISIYYLNNKLWIGTGQKGLYCLDLISQKLRNIPIGSSPNDDISVKYITSSKNQLWITTSYGLLRYDIETGIVSEFNKADGLQSNQFNPNSGLKTAEGCIFIGSVNGFNYFNPINIPDKGVNATIRFTDFTVSKQHERYSITINDEVKLNHTESVFSIEFASICYPVQSKIKYRYQLVGFDKSPIETTDNINKATYTNVPSGKYIFKLTHTDSHGIWSNGYETLHIEILAPWWLSFWMKCVYMLIVISSACLSVYYIIKKDKHKNQEKIDLLNIENEKQSLESKMLFFTNIAHEIRTPATLISGPIGTIMNSKSIPNDIVEDMEIIQKNSARLIGLVNQMLDLRNVEKGYAKVNLEIININDLLSNIIQQYKTYCNSKAIQLQLSVYSDENVIAQTDPEILSKIVTNLLSNAVKFTKSAIWVTIESKDNRFIITVLDNGVGIKPENIEKIFQPFFTTATEVNKLAKGFGIGLSLVSMLAEKIGAKISVDSKLGSYAQFSLSADCGDIIDQDIVDYTSETDGYDELEHIPITSTMPDNSNLQTVLIVEDNQELRNYFSKNISKQYHVISVENGVEAMAVIKKEAIDIIVSDIAMPLMDGIELCQTLKQNIEFCHIPIIILTAKTDIQSKISSVENGADVYLEKPISISLIYAHISGLLEKRQMLKSSFLTHSCVPLGNMGTNEIDRIFLQKVEEVIQNNISNQEFSVEDLAQHICISRSGLYAKLKAISELAPNEFIRLVRLRKAADYLVTKEFRINEICYLVGFNSPSYFTRCFVKQFGVLPKEYIEQNHLRLVD